MMSFLLVLIGLLVLLVPMALIMSRNINKTEEIKKEKEAQIQLAQKQREDRWAEKIAELEKNYGRITLKVFLRGGEKEWDDIKKQIFFFEESSTALIMGEIIPFKSILSYSMTDNQKLISTTSGVADSSTSTGSMVGRALVGGALLGGVGALAGAATADKKIDIQTTTSQVASHDYIIYLNIDSIANPQRIINFGSDAESANKTASVFNIIIKRNN